jgi:hypothetical protein
MTLTISDVHRVSATLQNTALPNTLEPNRATRKDALRTSPSLTNAPAHSPYWKSRVLRLKSMAGEE